MKNLVSDKACKKLDKDPTKTIAQNIKILEEKSNILSKINIKPINPLPSRLYELPKVHKLKTDWPASYISRRTTYSVSTN